MTTLVGDGGNNSLTGTSGSDSLVGGLGNDTLDGGLGIDTITGNEGNDCLAGGNEFDAVNGGTGDDTLVGGSGGALLAGADGNDLYVLNYSWVNVQENPGEGFDTVQTTLTNYGLPANVESVIYTGVADTFIRGNTSANTIVGGPGNDTLYGEGGSDSLSGGSGNDLFQYVSDDGTAEGIPIGGQSTISGGAGSDTYYMRLNASHISPDTISDFQAGPGGDLIYMEFLSSLNGINPFTAGNLRVIQNGPDTWLQLHTSGQNFQTILILSGIDASTLTRENFSPSGNPFGTTGIVFTGDNGPNFLFGTPDNDTASGNGGDDYLRGLYGDDSLSGDTGNDSLEGSVGDDTLVGGSGNDTLLADVGNDLLIPGPGDDSLYGTDGFDTVSFVDDTAGVTANMTGSSGSSSGHDQYSGIVNLIGGSGADSLTGDGNGNALSGGLGNDSLDGQIGTDSLAGGAGNDSLDGGNGIDTAIFTGNRVDYAIAVNGATITITDNRPGSPDGTDQITNAEYLQFADVTIPGTPDPATNDSLAGTGTIDGGAGNDTVSTTYTTFQDDLVLGGPGDNSLIGVNNYNHSDLGEDTFDGGPGNDTVFIGLPAPASVNQYVQFVSGAAQTIGGNEYLNIESVVLLGGLGNDTFIGDTGSDSLDGGAGNDSLQGGAGNDTISPGSNNDTIDGGSGTDLLTFLIFNGGVMVNLMTGTVSFSGNSVVSNIENVQGSSFGGGDTIIGDNADNSITDDGSYDFLSGNGGNDTIRGDGSAETILGGGGNDVLANAFINYSGNPLFGNSLSGDAGDDTIDSGGGNDTIAGGPGADQISGGGGLDVFAFATLSEMSGDEIVDFGIGEVLDFSAVAGRLFIGTGPFTGVAGEIRYHWGLGNTILVADINGDGNADAALTLDGGNFALGETSNGSGRLVDRTDTSPPLLVGTGPADNATNVALSANIVMTFDETVQAGTGALVIHNASDNSAAATISITDTSQVSFAGNSVTINPSADLASGSSYYVTLPSGAVTDLSSNPFVGISSPTALNFSTVDVTPPVLSSTNPADNATGVSPAGTISMTFNEAVKAGSGTISIHPTFGGITSTVSVTDSSHVSFSGNTVTINSPIPSASATAYFVTVDAGAITDIAGNAYAGIYISYVFNFTTAAGAPPEIAVTGNGTNIVDGDATPSGSDFTDFGTIAQGTAAVLHTFLVTNSGTGTLTTTGLTLPTGFVLVDGLSASIAAGTSDTFTVQLDPTNAGTYSGDINFITNDADESSFNFKITGSVAALTPLETKGATVLGAALNHFYLRDNAGAGPSLKFQGADFLASQFGAWTPLGVEKTGNGYEIAWKFGNADQYTVWSTDANGNYVRNAVGAVPGSNPALQSAETLFQQDLNGDGRIGMPPPAPIESHGATTLATAASLFYLQDNNGAGPTLKFQGANFVAGQSGFGAWTPIGAEKTGSGYEVVWKFGSADQYVLWSTDANGNYLTSLIGAVPGSDSTLQSAETLFQQDLNGDGRIGLPPAAPIESNGATKLVTAANLFYLQDNTGVGPTLKYQGANFVAGQSGFGAWTPIGAEKTGSGYEVAWKFGSADQYVLWSTDANGNYLTSLIGAVPGSDSTLQSAETLFQQDLNGDGRIGLPPAAPIESNGATKLVTAANLFYLQDSTGTDPTLKYQGANFIAGQFGAWTPIGAEATGNGYEIAWKFGGADQYTLWSMDTNGNYITNLIGAVAGSDATLQGAETLFQQDLNGNGQIGAPARTPIESAGATTLTTAANLFYLQDGTGAGPVLKYQGANFVAGQFGDWAPIGAEATGNGYEVVWRSESADQYTLWNTDANGNYSSNLIGAVTGSDSTLQAAETLLQQDLDHDGYFDAGSTQVQGGGQVFVLITEIETDGATTLEAIGNQFYLDGVGTVLKYHGGYFVAGQFGAWTPIGAEATANGYEIAWKFGSADQYTLWTMDANGNYIANLIGAVAGSDATLESAETLFQQDLNADGHFGLI